MLPSAPGTAGEGERYVASFGHRAGTINGTVVPTGLELTPVQKPNFRLCVGAMGITRGWRRTASVGQEINPINHGSDIYRIIKVHGGEIKVESKEVEETQFIILLNS